MSSQGNVKVVVRVRPWSQREKKASIVPVVSALSEKKEVAVIKEIYGRATSKKHVYQFDDVFTNFSTQEEVFARTLEPMIDDVMEGFEGTCFAYGQTGTGKTYTMEGDTSSEEHQGVIPRALKSIFERLEQSNHKETSVRVTYLEIYNEELLDLLVDSNGEPLVNPKLSQFSSSNTPRMFKQASLREKDTEKPPMLSRKLSIVEDKKKNGRGVHCQGLNEVVVEDVSDVLRLLEKAQDRRRVAETKLNKASSRSHCLFSVLVHTVDDDSEGVVEKTGRLHLCDLAGSECAKTSGTEGDVMERERKNINQSLLTLGRVISSLQSTSKATRVPYRDSKLTRILQEALGGRSKTCIIATVSPSILCVDETVSTLNYAQQASCIKNKTQVSSIKMSTNAYPLPTSASQLANQTLTGKGLAEWNDLECKLSYMDSQVEEAQGALGRKHAAMVAALNKVKGLEDDVARISNFAKGADDIIANDKLERDRFQSNALIHHATLASARNSTAAATNTAVHEAMEVFSGVTEDTHTWADALVSATNESGATIDECMTAVSECIVELQDSATSSILTMLKERLEQDGSLTEGTARRSSVIYELVDTLKKHMESGDSQLEVWANTNSENIAAHNDFLAEHGSESEQIITKVQSSLTQNMSSVEQLLVHQRKDIESLNENLKSQVVKEEEHKQQLNEMHETLLNNTEVIKKDIEKIAEGLSQAASQQEDGRRNIHLEDSITSIKLLVDESNMQEASKMKEKLDERMFELNKVKENISNSCKTQEKGRKYQDLNVGLESMHKLMDSSLSRFGSISMSNSDFRKQELFNISAAILESCQLQEQGREHESLSVGIQAMKNLIAKTSQEQQESLNENTKQRTEHLKAISNGLLSACHEQEQGRKHKELTNGLIAIKWLVEHQVEQEQAKLNKNTESRTEELKTISTVLGHTISNQESGRQHSQLVSSLENISKHVSDTAMQQREFITSESNQRLSELKKVSNDLTSAYVNQEQGRKNKELTNGLISQRSLIENISQVQQLKLKKNCDNRSKELCDASQSLKENCQLQEDTRSNEKVTIGLDSMRELVEKTANQQQSFVGRNANMKIESMTKMSKNLSNAATNQEKGRKNDELNSVHDEMLKLVQNNHDDLVITTNNNAQSRTKELTKISQHLNASSDKQEQGREHESLSIGLQAMKSLVDETSQRQQETLNENTKQRIEELKTISNDLTSDCHEQEEGRKYKELNKNLASMKLMVENVTKSEQTFMTKHADSRGKELKEISESTVENCDLQEQGRTNVALCSNLSQMQLLVHETCAEQSKKLKEQNHFMGETLAELQHGNAVNAHGSALALLKNEVDVSSTDILTDLLKQREGLDGIAAKLKVENGEEKTSQLLNGLATCIEDGRSSTMKQLDNQQNDMNATAIKLAATKTTDEANLVATLTNTETLLLQKVKLQQQSLDQQAAGIEAQSEKCNAMMANQVCMQEAMVANVMAGVADLLANGMATLNKSMGDTVEELTTKNEELTKANRVLHQEIETFKKEVIALKGTALSQVRAWGTANVGIRSDVLATKGKSEALGRETAAISLDCNTRLEAINSEVRRWATSNEACQSATEIESNAAKTIHTQLNELKSKCDFKFNELENESNDWGKSNYLVAEKLQEIIKVNGSILERNEDFGDKFEPKYEDAISSIDDWLKSDIRTVKNLKALANDTMKTHDKIKKDEEDFITNSKAFLETFNPKQEEASNNVASWLSSDEKVMNHVQSLTKQIDSCHESLEEDKNQLNESSQEFVSRFTPKQEEALSNVASWLSSDENVVADMRKLVVDTDAVTTALDVDKTNLLSNSEEFVSSFKPKQQDGLNLTKEWLNSDEVIVTTMRSFVSDTDNCIAQIGNEKNEFMQASKQFVGNFIPQQEECQHDVANWLAVDNSFVSNVRRLASDIDGCNENLVSDKLALVSSSEKMVASYLPQQEESLANVASWLESDESVVNDMKRLVVECEDVHKLIDKNSDKFVEVNEEFLSDFSLQQNEALTMTHAWLKSDESVVSDLHRLRADMDSTREHLESNKNEFIEHSVSFLESFVPKQEEGLAHAAGWLESDQSVVEDLQRLSKEVDTTSDELKNDQFYHLQQNKVFVSSMMPLCDEAQSKSEAWLTSDEVVVNKLNDVKSEVDKCHTSLGNDNQTISHEYKALGGSFTPLYESCLSHVGAWKANDDQVVKELHEDMESVKTSQSHFHDDYEYLIKSSEENGNKFHKLCEESIKEVKAWIDNDSIVCDDIETLVSDTNKCASDLLEIHRHSSLLSEKNQNKADTLISLTHVEIKNMNLLIEDSEEISKSLDLSANECKHGVDVIMQSVADLRHKMKDILTEQVTLMNENLDPREEMKREVKATCLEVEAGLEELTAFVHERCDASNKRMNAGLELHKESWSHATNAGCGGVNAARSGCKSIISLTQDSCQTHVGQVFNASKRHEKILQDLSLKVQNETAAQVKALDELAKGTGRLCSRSNQGLEEKHIPLLTDRTLQAHNSFSEITGLSLHTSPTKSQAEGEDGFDSEDESQSPQNMLRSPNNTTAQSSFRRSSSGGGGGNLSISNITPRSRSSSNKRGSSRSKTNQGAMTPNSQY